MASWKIIISGKNTTLVAFILIVYCGVELYWEVLDENVKGKSNTFQMSPLPVLRESDDTASVMRIRAETLRAKCFALSSTSSNYENLCHHVLENKRLGLGWCYVPKAGCTFWKKVFYILQTATVNNLTLDLDEIGFRYAHRAPIQNMCYHRQNKLISEQMASLRTLLIVRDPYSRLFSAYLDKFYLPDHWNSVGARIVQNFRRNATEISKRCGHDVTFKEFIKYVVHVGKTGKGVEWYVDDHWQPITTICLPCQVPYQFIAKQETFSSDRDFLLNKLHIDNYLKEPLTKSDIVKRTLSQRIQAYWITGLGSGCILPRDLMLRMWAAFQMQGYLPFNVTLQEHISISYETVTMEIFTDTVIRVFKTYINRNLTEQRLNAMTTSYRRLSLDQMRGIQNIYNLDFDLFGYDKEPAYLFQSFI